MISDYDIGKRSDIGDLKAMKCDAECDCMREDLFLDLLK